MQPVPITESHGTDGKDHQREEEDKEELVRILMKFRKENEALRNENLVMKRKMDTLETRFKTMQQQKSILQNEKNQVTRRCLNDLYLTFDGLQGHCCLKRKEKYRIRFNPYRNYGNNVNVFTARGISLNQYNKSCGWISITSKPPLIGKEYDFPEMETSCNIM